MPPNLLEPIAQACTAIANDVADDAGFVSMRRLLDRFKARLLIRPMLVEGMLATAAAAEEPTAGDVQWVVLVDAESYAVRQQDVESETPSRSLPNRLRNTIAHELLHSLAFRPSQFGIVLKRMTGKGDTADELVRAIEKETELLTPLLLWPDKALRELLRHKRAPLTVDELAGVRQTIRVSRHVLINRLSMLRRMDPDGLLASDGLRNLTVGLAEWCADGSSVLRAWPLFANFDRNLLPAFVRQIVRQDRSPAEAIFPVQASVMCGGGDKSVELATAAGTLANPLARELKVELSAEAGLRKPGSEFLFVARGATPTEQKAANYLAVTAPHTSP